MKLASKENYYLFFILFILALEAILFSVGNKNLDVEFLNEENKIIEIKNILSNIPIQAKAVSVYDQTLSRKIYGFNDETKLPIASLAKIMTVTIALNQHNLNDIVYISKEALKQETDYGFFVNEKFKIGDLAKWTLIGSANDGAYALAENTPFFLQKINQKAKKIGMKNAIFLNPTGLDISQGISGAYASAEDVNIMAMYALKAQPEIFSATVLPEINIKSESSFSHQIGNTNIILDKIPNILFSKTGLSSLAGGNLTIIYKAKNEHVLAITILGSTINGRFSDMQKIVNVLEN